VYPLLFFHRPLTVHRRFDRRLPIYPPTDHLSVCPSAYPPLFFRQLSVIVSTASWPSVRQLSFFPPTVVAHFDRRLCVHPLTVCRPFICRLPVCLSACLSSIVFPSTVRHCFDRFDHRLRIYPPTVHLSLSVCLPSLVFPPTVCHRFDRQLSVCPPTIPSSFPPSTVRLYTDCLSPFHPPTARLSVHQPVYPFLFFSTTTDCPSPFRSPAARLSVCLFVCLSSLVFPPTVNCRFDHRLSVYLPTVRHRFDSRLSVDPPTARLFVCPSTYPLLFFRQLSIIVSTASCLSDCLSVLSCFSQHPQTVRLSTDSPSPFRPSTVRLSTNCASPFRPPTVRLSTNYPSPF